MITLQSPIVVHSPATSLGYTYSQVQRVELVPRKTFRMCKGALLLARAVIIV